MDRSEAQRILIVKLGAIGDVVNSLPFVNRLRAAQPRAHITWAIAPLAHSLVRGQRAVDEFLVLDRSTRGGTRRFLRALRSREFDLTIDLQRLTKSGLITRLSGAARRLGFDRARCKEQSAWFTNEKLAPNAHPGTTLDQYLEFAEHLGLPPAPVTWDLPVEEPPPATGRGTGSTDGPTVVVSLGASKEANRWPAASWARLCAALHADLKAHIELSGGPQERPTAREVSALAAVPLEDRVGCLSLKQTGGLLAGADLFIGGDTGPLHMAVALGTPVVALFGSSDPARTGPWGQAPGVVQAAPPAAGCAPCRKRRCSVPGHPCMTDLSVEAVLGRARERLGASVGA